MGQVPFGKVVDEILMTTIRIALLAVTVCATCWSQNPKPEVDWSLLESGRDMVER